MQTRIEKLFSYSILYSHSSPNSAKVESTEDEFFLILYTYRNPDIYIIPNINYLSIEHFFRVYIASSKQEEELGEFETVMQTET